MPTVRGKSEVKAYFSRVAQQLPGVLRGAARAGGKVIAEEIRERTPSDEVRENLRMRTKSVDDKIRVTIDVKPGWALSVGTWLEWGTAPHFISVDDSQRRGRSVGRINQQLGEADGAASLVIGGKFVGKTVLHPGARPHPAFRPALDTKEAEAIAAAQAYINTRVRRTGIVGSDGGDDE
jgi:hypothetical protein